MKEVQLQVNGMTCGGCVRSVNRILSGVSGVKPLDVQIGLARLEAEDATAVQRALDALENGGYTAAIKNAQ